MWSKKIIWKNLKNQIEVYLISYPNIWADPPEADVIPVNMLNNVVLPETNIFS